jgi:hypothetical protein
MMENGFILLFSGTGGLDYSKTYTLMAILASLGSFQ